MNKNLLWFVPTVLLMFAVEGIIILSGGLLSFDSFLQIGITSTLLIGIYKSNEIK